MTITTVQIRLIADSEADARNAIDDLRNYVGSARIAINSPRPGRPVDGRSQWLAYGTFQFDTGEPPTVVAPVPPLAAPPATGPTTKLATTGKTRKLRRP